MATRQFTIVVRGESEMDAEEALHEAIERIKAGNLSGTDRNSRSGFYFTSTDDVPPANVPA